LKVYIIDGHALLTVADVVHQEKLGEVFEALDAMVREGTLLITRTVIEVLRHYDPNGHACIWANLVVALDAHVKVENKWKQQAQAAAQAAGFNAGLADNRTRQPTAAPDVAGLVLRELAEGREPVVVTEDWIGKPLRPALGQFCRCMSWATSGLASFLADHSLGHCVVAGPTFVGLP
jgi:hypothetical protein